MILLDLLVFLLYLFYPFQEKGLFGIQYLKLYYLIFIALLYIVFIGVLQRRVFCYKLINFYLLYTPFLAWMFLSISWSLKYGDSIYASMKYFVYFMIGFVISCYLLMTRNFEKVLIFLYISAFIISLLYFYTFVNVNGFEILSGQVYMSTIAKLASINVGFGGGRNLLASWLSFSLTFSLPFLLILCRGAMRVVLYLTSIFLLFVLFLTLSRTAILALVFFGGSILILTQNVKFKKTVVSFLLFVIIISILVLETNILNLGNFLKGRFIFVVETLKGEALDYGTIGRLELWNYAVKSFFDSPLLGSGIGTLYKGLSEIGGVNNYHNIFLQFLAQTGLVGLLFFLIWTIWLFYKAYLIRFLPYKEYSFLSQIVFVNILLYYFKSLLMFQYFDLEIWTLIGFVGALCCYEKN